MQEFLWIVDVLKLLVTSLAQIVLSVHRGSKHWAFNVDPQKSLAHSKIAWSAAVFRLTNRLSKFSCKNVIVSAVQCSFARSGWIFQFGLIVKYVHDRKSNFILTWEEVCVRSLLYVKLTQTPGLTLWSTKLSVSKRNPYRYCCSCNRSRAKQN